MKYPCVYIVTNEIRGVLYTGVTSNLLQRTYQHKTHLVEGFTNHYNCIQLVYCEFFDTMEEAICHEKKLKYWKRSWKITLIEKNNPGWKDLYDDIISSHPYF